MFRRILRLVAETGSIRCEELAQALDTSPEIVRLALAELARRDYLQVISECGATCEHCPIHAACHYRCQPQLWMLTDKGAAWIRETA